MLPPLKNEKLPKQPPPWTMKLGGFPHGRQKETDQKSIQPKCGQLFSAHLHYLFCCIFLHAVETKKYAEQMQTINSKQENDDSFLINNVQKSLSLLEL